MHTCNQLKENTMKRVIGIALLLAAICSTTSWGFNGQRRGFVLGGGLGFTPVATIKSEDSDFDESNAGVALNFLIGYAWDNQNMLVFLHDGAWSEVEGEFEDIRVSQGFNGPSWFHYFGQMGHSAFINVGLGLQEFSSLESEYESNDPGFGALIGGGYEFTPHVQIYGSFSFGNTEYDIYEYKHTQLQVSVSAIAF